MHPLCHAVCWPTQLWTCESAVIHSESKSSFRIHRGTQTFVSLWTNDESQLVTRPILSLSNSFYFVVLVENIFPANFELLLGWQCRAWTGFLCLSIFDGEHLESEHVFDLTVLYLLTFTIFDCFRICGISLRGVKARKKNCLLPYMTDCRQISHVRGQTFSGNWGVKNDVLTILTHFPILVRKAKEQQEKLFNR